MTPAARVQAAIEILDRIAEGSPAEKALTNWARKSRFAGSKDRAAVRDHVYDVLRQKRSLGAIGGETSRGLMAGLLIAQGEAPEDYFGAGGHGPEALTAEELDRLHTPDTLPPDLPEWLVQRLEDSLGDKFADYCEGLRHRAPVHLRVNPRKTSREAVSTELEKDGVKCEPLSGTANGLIVLEGARRVAQSSAYRNGLVELQDGSGQAAMELIPLTKGLRVLDYCAGGGGKVSRLRLARIFVRSPMM